jgi:hypothetical protein
LSLQLGFSPVSFPRERKCIVLSLFCEWIAIAADFPISAFSANPSF